MIRATTLLAALALASPALAQTTPTATPKSSTVRPANAKPSSAKPLSAKPSSAKPSSAKPSSADAATPATAKPVPPKPRAGATSAAPTGDAQQGPCIGVIPRIGDLMEVQNIGVTVFSNDFKEVPIESWGLDDLAVARVHAAAGAHFAVRRISYAGNAFDPFEHPASRLFRNAENDLKGVVQSIARGSGCERYVVVVKSETVFGDTHSILKGVGVVNRDSVLFGHKSWLYALSGIWVFDGRTFDVLKKGVGSSGEDFVTRLLVGSPVHGPGRELADFPWPPPPERLTGLRDQARSLLAESLDRALPELLAR